MLWKCCTQYACKFGKLSSGHRTGKVSFHSNSKECSNYCTVALISHVSNDQNSPSQASTVHEPWTSRCSAEFRKGRGTRDQTAKSTGSSKMQESSRKTSTSALLTTPKPLTVWITINCGKFYNRWEYQTSWPASWETCMQVKKPQLELGMEQRTGSKLGKKYIKALYCHPAYLTCMQSTSYEMPGWMNHKLESRLPGEISITSDMQMTSYLWQRVKN